MRRSKRQTLKDISLEINCIKLAGGGTDAAKPPDPDIYAIGDRAVMPASGSGKLCSAAAFVPYTDGDLRKCMILGDEPVSRQYHQYARSRSLLVVSLPNFHRR